MLPKKAALLKFGFSACLIILSTSRCGTLGSGKRAEPTEKEILNRKIVFLTDQMDKQAQTIEKLRSQISDLTTIMETRPDAAAVNVKPQPRKVVQKEIPAVKLRSLPVEKLRPNVLSEFVDQDLDLDKATTIADSANEAMHSYFQAMDEQRSGNYEKALRLFREFAANNPTHVYADRAQFQIENTHYLNKEYSLAVVASGDLETKYSYSLKLPEGLYIRAASYAAMGQEEPTRTTINRLLKFFPKDPATLLATQRLAVALNVPRAHVKPAVPLLPKGQK